MEFKLGRRRSKTTIDGKRSARLTLQWSNTDTTIAGWRFSWLICRSTD